MVPPDKLELPAAPPHLIGSVKCWSEPVVIKTYAPMRPDKHPMFLENRVYQGSSGRVYPLPFIERIAREPIARAWQAVHLENEYLRVMILPELGGRIHVGFDKTNGYDFFYRQNVIKPALVGLAGPWISGGVEFNWPQHHRPATYMPVEVVVEEHADGSFTAWCGDHDPFDRLKGMHGVCLHPRKAHVELKVRLYNRTELTQTFLWWANMGVHVDEHYQSFFPPDVHYVADHAKRATSTFPLCDATYYGIDYGARSTQGIPANELPSNFLPPGDYPPNDLSWYANIPVPTSYMALASKGDFFGGYDHRRQAGVVHVADHHIAPGKKQWTWGNSDFGYAWDRNLTDSDGPYIELMAGVYTDNQPDFSFLAPGESKAFSQYWYPIQHMGVPSKANERAALRLALTANSSAVQLTLCVTEEYVDAVLSLGYRPAGGEPRSFAQWTLNLKPGRFWGTEASVPAVCPDDLYVELRDSSGQEILCYRAAEFQNQDEARPEAAVEPVPPSAVASSDELYLIGRHLAQYRHATRSPVPYWREAIRRDPSDSRSNTALGVWRLRRGEFSLAEQNFRTAVTRITKFNPNPEHAEASYHLGLTLRYQGKEQQAYDAFYKAAWSYETRSCAYHALAEMDAASGRLPASIEKLRLALGTNAGNSNARSLGVVLLRTLKRNSEAQSWLEQNLTLDLTDQWSRYLDGGSQPVDNQMALDLAFDYSRAGLHSECCQVLEQADFETDDGSVPMLCYTLGYAYAKSGNKALAQRWLARARSSSPEFCFPNRLEEMLILQWAVELHPSDAQAHRYLGNFLYDRRRYAEAIEHWERSVNIHPELQGSWRNLGLAYFNVLDDPERARNAFDRAFQLDPTDARVFYERDQLWKRIGILPRERLAELQSHLDLVEVRDDLLIEFAALCNQEGQHERALSVLSSHVFQPWEGGEGLATEQYVRTRLALGRGALVAGEGEKARAHFEAALASPMSLGEAKHPLVNQAHIYYWLGVALERIGNDTDARRWWTLAAATHGDFQHMSVQPFSEITYYRALALAKLGQTAECRQTLNSLLLHAKALESAVPTVDYFATSLPAMLLFKEDLPRSNAMRARFLQAQASVGLGRLDHGTALLQEILESDPNYPLAVDLLQEIRCNELLTESSALTSERAR